MGSVTCMFLQRPLLCLQKELLYMCRLFQLFDVRQGVGAPLNRAGTWLANTHDIQYIISYKSIPGSALCWQHSRVLFVHSCWRRCS